MTRPRQQNVLALAITLALTVALAVASCGPASPSGAPSPGSHSRVITAFVAASLRDAMAAATPTYADATGVGLDTSADASTALRVQIEQGARADIFLSADTKSPDALLTGGLVIGGVVPFAQNSLAIIVPKGNPAGINSVFELGRRGLKIVAAGDGVPISTYAAALISNLAVDAQDPSSFAAAYAANVVTREDNVKAVVAKIALGEGDAAIVYATDALAERSVSTIPIPDGSNVLATYAGIVPTTALHPDAGRAFLTWLAGPSGQAILARFGFVPLVAAPS
ncbi:MAG: molybdate ABC transporter substrate-binding protein [Chloroflexota bacterium]